MYIRTYACASHSQQLSSSEPSRQSSSVSHLKSRGTQECEVTQVNSSGEHSVAVAVGGREGREGRWLHTVISRQSTVEEIVRFTHRAAYV